MTLVTREFAPKQRGLAMGFWAIASDSSMSPGPAIGGYLIGNFGCRPTFFLNVPVGVAAIFATLILQREKQNAVRTSFDGSDFFLIAFFLVPLLIALSDGNAAWNSAGRSAHFSVVCLLISGFSLLAFVAVELNSSWTFACLKISTTLFPKSSCSFFLSGWWARPS